MIVRYKNCIAKISNKDCVGGDKVLNLLITDNKSEIWNGCIYNNSTLNTFRVRILKLVIKKIDEYKGE